MDAAPFVALRYDPAVVGDLVAATAPAYDALGPVAFARHRTANPYTVLELLADDGAFRAAGATLRRWRRTGVLVRDDRPAYHRYEVHWLRAGVPVVQRGVLAAVAVAGEASGLLPHEHVDERRVHDRLRRLEAVPVDVAPVFALVHDAPPALAALLQQRPTEPPVVALTDDDGVDHRIWRVDDPEQLAAMRAALEPVQAVIADGHHRWAAARARRLRVLTYLVDAEHGGPDVHGVHRLVRRLPPDALGRLRERFAVEEVTGPPAAALGRHRGTGVLAVIAGAGQHPLLVRPSTAQLDAGAFPPGRSGRWRRLDTAIIEHLLLPCLGAEAGAVEHVADLGRALAAVDGGRAAAALLARPVPPAQVHAHAAAGEVLPAKSTSFTPKPRTGLILRELDDHPTAPSPHHGRSGNTS